ncbi:hypothetical protein Ngar_c31390 [Candidatus Nitrososphaera gargensis Ga9.2]|uniref:Uncharacterized protein n=1 Tax=Nitrososphaera gargensis (strain Ga9.2) TaxID=1237085 RepID=K0IJ77_NITGG|nr:hypothetical protein [Candidatus Nitrososphaera gargensis]AFU60055.1 hypothetical protein Ngar_c31390 [Candidatus Nitrososphaera gargensis Ga9.2]
MVNASLSNVSECLKFWKSLGMLEDQDGKSKPSQTLTAIVQKMEWGSDDDGWKLFRDAIGSSWFVSSLAVAFRLKKSLSEDEILNTLGLTSKLPDREKVEKPLKNLIQLLNISKILIPGDDGRYTLNPDIASRQSTGTNMVVDDSKQMAQVRIGGDTYVVEVEALRDFVKANGKTVDTNVNSVGG